MVGDNDRAALCCSFIGDLLDGGDHSLSLGGIAIVSGDLPGKAIEDCFLKLR
ncbi:hypothetical protein [Rhizobium laguerreae]|uniref:hypothetical protein n=1 Tax=Rhizobium laguerreae TaxID=1076926 RepID=UPI001C905385|nr:hypothetical protein [Rhizobium laguerreae]MBY3201326.1 hypothetical protein [Rhizobium laguerreae]